MKFYFGRIKTKFSFNKGHFIKGEYQVDRENFINLIYYEAEANLVLGLALE